MAMHARCGNCGCFRAPVPAVAQGDLFGTILPFPTSDNPFSRFHTESHERERLAAARGDDRGVGAERKARENFTLRALAHNSGHQNHG